jgi:hypothetical protein
LDTGRYNIDIHSVHFRTFDAKMDELLTALHDADISSEQRDKLIADLTEGRKSLKTSNPTPTKIKQLVQRLNWIITNLPKYVAFAEAVRRALKIMGIDIGY